MQEEEACKEEEDHEEEEDDDIEMTVEEECGGAKPSGPQEAAGTDNTPLRNPTGDAISPEEDTLLMQQVPQPADPTTGSHSPRSEAGMVS